MGIRININPFLKQYTNSQSEVEVNGDTVGQCLDLLVKQFPGIEKGIFNKNGGAICCSGSTQLFNNRNETLNIAIVKVMGKIVNKPLRNKDQM